MDKNLVKSYSYQLFQVTLAYHHRYDRPNYHLWHHHHRGLHPRHHHDCHPLAPLISTGDAVLPPEEGAAQGPQARQPPHRQGRGGYMTDRRLPYRGLYFNPSTI